MHHHTLHNLTLMGWLIVDILFSNIFIVMLISWPYGPACGCFGSTCPLIQNSCFAVQIGNIAYLHKYSGVVLYLNNLTTLVLFLLTFVNSSSGTVRRRWRPSLQTKKSEVDLVFQANNLEVCNSQRCKVIATAPDIKECFTEYWSKFEACPLKGRDQILMSVCPQVNLITVT